MVEIEVLSGKLAGKVYLARQFPFVIGRSQNADLSSADPGLWDRHAEIDFARGEGFILTVQPGATATVNDRVVTRTRLRPGDTVQCGTLRFRLWLSPPRQSQHSMAELSVWGLLVLVFAVQMLLLNLLTE